MDYCFLIPDGHGPRGDDNEAAFTVASGDAPPPPGLLHQAERRSVLLRLRLNRR